MVRWSGGWSSREGGGKRGSLSIRHGWGVLLVPMSIPNYLDELFPDGTPNNPGSMLAETVETPFISRRTVTVRVPFGRTFETATG